MISEIPFKKVKKYPFESFVNSVDAIVYTVDLQSQEIIFCNEKAKEEFGDIIGEKYHKFFKKVSSNTSLDFNTKELGEEINEYIHIISNKIYIFSEKIVEDYKRKERVKINVGLNITDKRRDKLMEKEQKFKNLEAVEAILNSTLEALFVYDGNKECIKVNDVVLDLLGYEKSEIIGESIFSFVATESFDLVRKSIAKNHEKPYEALLIKKNKEKIPCLIRGKYIDLCGERVRVAAALDIRHIKEKEHEIVKLAFYDSLTTLPNKTLLIDRVEQLLKKLNKNNHYGALLVIDLDHFKNINDIKGHLVGDKILIECAKRLKYSIINYDTISRFGGDEFIILIDTQTNSKISAANSIEDTVKMISETIKKPYIIDANEYLLTASIGIVIFNGESTFDDILKSADSAMNFAKQKGRDTFNFFDPKLQEILERKAMVTKKLRDAIKYNLIKIVYQKQVCLNRKVVGVEALARWEDKELGSINPQEFIPIAEESGLIVKFGYFLIEEVAKTIKQWQSDKEKCQWRVSINVSLSQFERDDFVTHVEQMIKQYNISPNLLRLEITESILLNNSDNAVEKIDYLKQLGLTISIDDFGTGYSSLAYLKKLSIDELKIDKSFIEDILVDDNDEILVTAILGLGNKFGFDVIAEGVETEEIYEKLKKLGCKYFQGFYFSKPLPKERL